MSSKIFWAFHLLIGHFDKIAFPYSGAQLSAKTYFIPSASAKSDNGFIFFSSSALTSCRANTSAFISLSTSTTVLRLECVLIFGFNGAFPLNILPPSVSLKLRCPLFFNDISLSGRFIETLNLDFANFCCFERLSWASMALLCKGDCFSMLLGRSTMDFAL